MILILVLSVFSGGYLELLFKFSGKGRVVLEAALKTYISNGGGGGA